MNAGTMAPPWVVEVGIGPPIRRTVGGRKACRTRNTSALLVHYAALMSGFNWWNAFHNHFRLAGTSGGTPAEEGGCSVLAVECPGSPTLEPEIGLIQANMPISLFGNVI